MKLSIIYWMEGIHMSLNINEVFSQFQSSICSVGNDLSEKLNSFDGKSMSQEEMLEMQFLVNQYNCMLETASTVSKSLTDEAKQIAQRSQ